MAKVKLGDVAIEKRETWTGPTQGVPIVGLEHLVPGEVTLSSWDSDSDNTFSKMFRKDQVLLGRRRVYLKKAVIAPFDGICSGDITVIEAIPGKISSRLLPFVIQNERFFDYAMQGSAGSLSPRVKWEHLKDYEFNLPDYENQDCLADKLWSALKLKESYQRLLVATDEMVKSRFIEEFNNPEIPKVSMSELCTTFIDGDWIEAKDQSDSGYRLVQTGNVGVCEYVEKEEHARFVSEDTFKRLNCTEIHPGDILFSRLPDPIGRCCMIPQGFQKAITAVDCTIIRLKDNCLPEYLMVYTTTNMYSEQIKTCITGTTRQRISRGNLAKIQVPLPTTDCQQSFVNLVHQADKSKFELKQAIEKIDKVMRALMQ